MRWIFVLLFLTSFLFAQSNEECMECHSDPDLTGFINDTTEISVYVDTVKFAKSVHAEFECIDCHTDVEDVDHDEDLQKVDCSICHEDSQEEFAQSVHAIPHSLDPSFKVSCSKCHGTHDIMYSDDELSKTYKLNIDETCGNCHSKPEVIKLLGLRGDGPVTGYHESIHNKILVEEPDKGPPTCINCHGYHEIYLMSDPRSKFNKLNRPETCGECHQDITEEYYESIHWYAVKHGHFESPVCNDCHGEHGIQAAHDKDSRTSKLEASSQICANCHASEVMMQRFGLDPGRFDSYMKSYHGLAVLKGSPEAASCVSCHEVHSIRSQRDKNSSVHKDNLAKTCGQCHENITKQFLAIPAHPGQLEERNYFAYYAKMIYIWMIILVIGGMVVHNIIIFSYYLRKKRILLKGEKTVQRFLPFEVYQHMFLILSFFTLVVTGFALKFPDSFWVEWLVALGMTEPVRSNLHRIAAVIMVAGSMIQLAYFIFHKKGRSEIFQLRPELEDITGFWANMKYHLYLSKDKPKFGRWDYTEKAEYLALIWGTAVMAVTGFILWFPEFFMRFLPWWTFEVSEIIHYFEAWLATLAIIIWHWFFVIFHPEKYPMSLTWMNGRITEDELKHHHPLEYEK